MSAVFIAGLAGLLFALGLGIGGMTDPSQVVGFLDFAGDWKPGLAVLMAGALGTHALLRRLISRRAKPVLAPAFPAMTQARVDARLVVGAALFGVGWGLGGYCPGPALASVATGGREVALFVAAMVGGMLLFRAWERRASRPDAPGAQRMNISGG